jgi:hypothetical protein
MELAELCKAHALPWSWSVLVLGRGKNCSGHFDGGNCFFQSGVCTDAGSREEGNPQEQLC